MVPRDAMISDDETGQFAQEVIDCLACHGHVTPGEARKLYDRSVLPGGLAEAPDYYLHESPYYWAMYILTGNRAVGQDPSPMLPPATLLSEAGPMTWDQVQQMIRTTALPVRSINWKGRAECPEAAWVITTLDGPGNRLLKPDRLTGSSFLLSAENVDPPTTRMLSSKCRFSLHILKRIPGTPVRYQHLGLGTVIAFDDAAEYPHWKIELRPVSPLESRQVGS